jgi:peptidase S41-like protein
MRSLRLGWQILALLGVVSASPILAQSIEPAAAREDFDVLWKSIREAHGGLNRHVAPAELDRLVAAHRARIGQSMTVKSFAGLLQESISELRDGHMRLEPDSATAAAYAAAQVLPLRVALEANALVVSFNDTPSDTTIKPGMTIVSINGHTPDAIVRQFLPKVPGDGFIETGKRFGVARQFPLLYWMYVEDARAYTVVARDANGRQVTATLPGIVESSRRQIINPVNASISQFLARLDGPPGNVALEFLNGGPVARVRVRAFDGQAFTATLDSAFRAIRERGTTSLILDLRGNGGGVDDYGAALVSQFTDKPFRYFDHIHVTTIAPSFATWLPRTFEAMRTGTVPDPAGGFRITSAQHRGVAEWQPATTPFLGKLVILVDGGTFSTAADVASQLKSMSRGTFLGEETGGAYEGNTSGLNASIVLPTSRLRLRIMMYDYWNAVKPPATRGRGTIPDRVVLRRVADVLRGVDPAIAEAIRILN